MALVLLLAGCVGEGAPATPAVDGSPVALPMSGGFVPHDVTQWPTAGTTLSSPFGPRLKASQGYVYDFHRGIDIPGTLGDPVWAIADGEIYRAYFEGDPANPYPNSGNVVVLRHVPDRSIPLHGIDHDIYYSVYGHLDTITVTVPVPGGPYEAIALGDPLGTLGQSGTTTFDHVHFEIRVGTTCSREYQVANPQASCSSTFGATPQDPHVNPLLLLDYPDGDDYRLDVLQRNPVVVRFRSHRDELDLDEVRIRWGAQEKWVGFDDRAGIDPVDIDNPIYDGVRIDPAEFRSSSTEYEITLEFQTLADFDWIEIRDVRGAAWRVPGSEVPRLARNLRP